MTTDMEENKPYDPKMFDLIHEQAELYEREFKVRRMWLAAFFCLGSLVGGVIIHAAFMSTAGANKERVISVDELTANPSAVLEQSAKAMAGKSGSYIVKLEVKPL